MEKKKSVKQNFLQKFLNFNLKKKEKKRNDKKKGIKKEEPNLLLIITLLFMSPTTQIFPFVPGGELSDMILIIRSNISTNGKESILLIRIDFVL